MFLGLGPYRIQQERLSHFMARQVDPRTCFSRRFESIFGLELTGILLVPQWDIGES